MLTVEPTAEMIKEWKLLYDKNHDKLKPNRRTGAEVDRYFRDKYAPDRLDASEFRNCVEYNIMMNEPNKEKLPDGVLPEIVAYIIKKYNILVGIDLITGYIHVESEDTDMAAEIYDDLFAFRGLDEKDIENYYLVACYMESIEKTRREFEESFRTGSYYNKQTRDAEHLELILNCVQVETGMRILDLGTGTGYLAFPFAQKYKSAEVVGLDIVEKTLEDNRKRAVEEGLTNLHFVGYEGMKFPFENESFDIVITRYALHHFPGIRDTFHEIHRVLKDDGIFFLSDPAPNDDDAERFVDEYMQMKKDGHIRFYTKQEWTEIGKEASLQFMDGFETTIRFPRKRETAYGFDDIISRHDKNVIKGYGVEVTDDEIWITEKVNNLLFRKPECRELLCD